MAEYIEKNFAQDVIRRTSGDYAAAFKEIAHATVADVTPVAHGRWRYALYPSIWYGSGEPPEFVCSHCDERSNNTYDYCPNCGAKMDLKC